MTEILQHIGFILDGNRRWAKSKNLPSLIGHKSGYDLVKQITRILPKYGVKYVTYYMFSTENWNRSDEEIKYLMDLFREILATSVDFFNEKGIRIIPIGDLSRLPNDVFDSLQKITEATKNNSELTVCTAISYGGRDEILRAAKKMCNDAVNKNIDFNSFSENDFATYLDTADVPYPDAIVRTSEQRLSNFLTWESAYSEIFFIDKLWPDFNETDVVAIFEEYKQRKRRYGK